MIPIMTRLGVLLWLCALVQPFDEEPALFLLNSEFGSTLSSPRQRLAEGASRAVQVGWTDDRTSKAVGHPSLDGVQGIIHDPELLQTLYSRERQLGEPKEHTDESREEKGSGSNATKGTEFEQRVKQILGTFVIEMDRDVQPAFPQDQLTLIQEAESTPAINKGDGTSKDAPGSNNNTAGSEAKTGLAVVDEDIVSAKHIINEENLAPQVKNIAAAYLKKKQEQRQNLKAGTVKQLSEQLFQAKLASAQMEMMKKMAETQFVTPEIGKKYRFGLGDSQDQEITLMLKVDGVNFESGASFTAPEGHIVSAERCERYLQKYNASGQVSAAEGVVSETTAKYAVARAQAKKLSKIAVNLKDSLKAANPDQASSKDGEKTDQDIVQADAAMTKAAHAVRVAKALKVQLKAGQEKLKTLKSKENQSKARITKQDNLDAREAELDQREKAIAEREFVYKQAAEKLKEAALSLKHARQNQAVVEYPEQERELKDKLRKFEIQQNLAKVQDLKRAHEAELLATKMKAFDQAVQHIIQSSAKSSAGIADDWTKKSEAQIGNEVDGFTAMLQQIKNKFRSSNRREATAAKDGAAIISAVHEAVRASTNQLHREHLAQEKWLNNTIAEDQMQTDVATTTAKTIDKSVENRPRSVVRQDLDS